MSRISAITPEPATQRRVAAVLAEFAARFGPMTDLTRAGSAVAG